MCYSTIKFVKFSTGEVEKDGTISSGMSRLLSAQRNKHNGQQFFCVRCLNAFQSQRVLANHSRQCKEHHAQRTVLPSVDKDGQPQVMKFTKTEYQLPTPFTVYADFESVLAPISTASPNPVTSSTTPTQHHRACSASYVIVGVDGRFYREPVLIRATSSDDDVVDQFLTRLQSDVAELKKCLANETPMSPLTLDQQTEFHALDAVCHICSNSFQLEDVRHRDHCHLTGKFR